VRPGGFLRWLAALRAAGLYLSPPCIPWLRGQQWPHQGRRSRLAYRPAQGPSVALARTGQRLERPAFSPGRGSALLRPHLFWRGTGPAGILGGTATRADRSETDHKAYPEPALLRALLPAWMRCWSSRQHWHQKAPGPSGGLKFCFVLPGEPRRTRTCNPLIKSQLLCQLS
jgi:hypothetical protein